jgi:Asp-tRNA(Asn)/Glu-tRNA(Gln) amidotransferase A subunit family amidase
VVLSPSRTSTAPALIGVRPPRDPSKHSELLRTAGNLAGVPGISVPAGLALDGLPTGLQLVGPRGSDRLLVALAAEFQRRTSHHLLRPPDLAA